MPGRSLALALALTFLTLSARSQVPFGHFVVSLTGTSKESTAYFVDPRTGDLTPVLGLPQGQFADFRLVAVEPASGSILSAANVIAINASFLNRHPLAGRVAGQQGKINWTQPKGVLKHARVIGGGNVLLAQAGTGLWLAPLAGGTATQLGTLTNTEAIVADGQFAYVLTRKAGSPSTIWKYDFINSTFVQAVSSLPEARAFDVFPASPLLLAGTQAGDLYLVDTISGLATLFRNVGTSPIVAMRRSPSGELLIADQGGRLFTMSSLPNPIATLPGTPTDMDVGTSPVASFFTFGKSCAGSGGIEPVMGSTGLPSLGNAGFAFTVSNGLGGAPAVLAMGSNRSSWGAIQLPFDLTSLGAPACALRVNGILLAGLALAGSGPGGGSGSLGAPIPNLAALANVVLACQWWCVDLAGNQLGLTTSDGGEAILR